MYLRLRDRLNRMDSRYGECPDICGQTGEPAKEFCTGCPVKKADERFERDTLAELNTRFGERWRKYSFEMLQTSVVNAVILDRQDDAASWFTGTDILIQTLRIEQQKIDKIEQQNILNRYKGGEGKGSGKRKQRDEGDERD